MAPVHTLDRARLWVGGVAVSLVCGLVGLVALFVARGLFDVSVWLPDGDGRLVDADAWAYAAVAALAALAAVALMDALVHWAPAPDRIFSWIVGLATVAAALWPFTVGVEVDEQVATAACNLAVGLAILSLVPQVAHGAMRATAVRAVATG